MVYLGFPGGSDSKESACSAEDPGLISGSGRFSGEENGYPLQYSCLENSMGRGAWHAIVHGVSKSRTRLKRLSSSSSSPGGSDGKESCNAGDLGSIPVGKIP